MTQRKYLLLGVAAALALAIVGTFAVRELTTTDAAATEGQMSITMSAGGTCAAGKCTVPLSGAFTLQINSVKPPAAGYIGMQTEMDYQDLVTAGGSYKPTKLATTEINFAGALPLRSPAAPTGTEGLVNHANPTGLVPPFPVSHYTGPLVTLNFNCSSTASSNTFVNVPLGAGNTNGGGYKSAAGGFPQVPSVTESLEVNCGSAPVPTVTPTTAQPTVTPTTGEPPTVTPTTQPGEDTPTPGPTNTPTHTPTTGPATATPTRTNTPPPATPTRTRTPTPPPGEDNGDVNCDGEIDSVDSLWVLWWVAELVDSVPCPENADADKDGDVDSVDSALILQYSADLIPTLPPS